MMYVTDVRGMHYLALHEIYQLELCYHKNRLQKTETDFKNHLAIFTQKNLAAEFFFKQSFI